MCSQRRPGDVGGCGAMMNGGWEVSRDLSVETTGDVVGERKATASIAASMTRVRNWIWGNREGSTLPSFNRINKHKN